MILSHLVHRVVADSQFRAALLADPAAGAAYRQHLSAAEWNALLDVLRLYTRDHTVEPADRQIDGASRSIWDGARPITLAAFRS